MTLINAVEAARDVAGLAALVLFALLAALLWTGATGVSSGIAAAIAMAAAGGACAVAFYGAVGALTGAGGGVIALVGVGLLVAGGFASAQYYGVRGFWMFFTLASGAGMGALLMWLFASGATGPVGPLAPLMAVAVMLLLVFGALGSVSAGAGATPDQRRMQFAKADFTRPPSWFDCAYATFGGEAEEPARCPFTPPEVEKSPTWAEDRAAPETIDQALSEEARLALRGGATVASDAPAASTAPAAKDLRNPTFDKESAPGGAVSGAPGALDAPEAIADAADVRHSSSTNDRAPAPNVKDAPEDLATSSAPDEEVAPLDGRDETQVAAADELGPVTVADLQPQSLTSSEGVSTGFVCFSALGAASQRLCPDQVLTEKDLEVAWRDENGEAIAAEGALDCYFNPDLPVYATVIVNLSGALAGEIPQAGAASGVTRRSEAIYRMVTRIIAGSARTSGEAEKDQLYLSLYLVGGSPLRAPWAEIAHAEDRSDRLFDIRSFSQTLGLMQHLRGELEALGPGALRGDLAFAVNDVLDDRPRPPQVVGENLIILVTDSSDGTALERADALKLGAAAAERGAPIFVVEIGEDRGGAGVRVLAERSGGALLRAESAEQLETIAERTLRRARSFCAVRVSAPSGFFERGSVEMKLRRQLDNSCVLEQIAVVDCAGLRRTERVLPSDL